MLVLRPIGGGQARYYLDGPAPGRWVGNGCEELALRGDVEEASLHAVLAGGRPGGGVLLERIPAARRSGFDLIMAAPKSVSLLAALAADQHQVRFRQAHQEAVSSALDYLQREATWTRRGRAHTREPTSGLVGAAFNHSLSGSRDPHLHTHVVVANVVHGQDGRWSTLDSRSLYRHAGAAGALYQAALRHHLGEQGLRFEWTVSRHGLGDIVGVPRAAIDAASLRQRQVSQEIEAGLAGRVGRATAAGRTRREAGVATGSGSGSGSADWTRRVAAAGLDSVGAERLLTAAVTRRSMARAGGLVVPDTSAVERLVCEQHSRFARPDVVRAAATLSVAGAPVAAVEAAADGFLKSALPAGEGMWTTAGLKRLEQSIVAAATPRAHPTAGLVAPGTPPGDDLSEMGRTAVARLTHGGAPVELLRGDLISQAQVLEAARRGWESSGHRVALVSPTVRDQARWRTLAGLEPPPPLPTHATVVLVDNAERWSTADLHHVLTDATARQAKVVLLDGGSQPRRRRAESPAMETLRTSLVPIDPGPAPPLSRTVAALSSSAAPSPSAALAQSGALAPSAALSSAALSSAALSSAAPAPRLEAPVSGLPPPAVVPAGRGGTVILAPTGRDAMAHLVGDWHRRAIAGERPRMVALGPEEAEYLNAMARAARVEAGELRGPAVEIGGRHFQAGDEVAALRRDTRLGSVPGGTVGRVQAVDPALNQATIDWQGRDAATTVAGGTPTAGADPAGPGIKGQVPLTHGYATTPPYLRRGHDGPVLGLGPIEAVTSRLKPDRIYDVVPTPASDRGRHQLNPVASLFAELPGCRDRSPGGVPSDAAKPLNQLAAERDRLADHLRANVPPDTRPELRRLIEDRDSLASIPFRPGRPFGERASTLAALDGRIQDLTTAARAHTEWLQEHRGQFERWSDLAHAVAWRESALGRGAELRPSVAVLSQLGPPPLDAVGQPVWRQAAEAIEAHRERWDLPDRPLELEPGTTRTNREPDLDRRVGELRVLATAQELQRIRGRDRGLAPSGF